LKQRTKVWDRIYEVEVVQQSKSVWIAVGAYEDHQIRVQDRTPGAALKRWSEAARFRGG